LIHSQRPTATRVAGFRTWHELGRSVNKGEKGVAILAPILVRDKDVSRAGKGQAKSEDAHRLAGFRTAYVFDVSQTEGKPLPQFAQTTGDPKDYSEKLKALVARRGIDLKYDPTIAPAQGGSTGGRIRLLPGLSPAEEFSVLTHELAHEMLHHDGNATRPKLVTETQAEAVAFVVSRGIGLETNNAHSDYIALYQGHKETLAASLSVIQEASAKILDELTSERRQSEGSGRTSLDATTEARLAPLSPAPSAPDLPAALEMTNRSDAASLDR
jgi:antirestriction protein ArdC